MTVTVDRPGTVICLERGRVAHEATGLAALSDRWIPIGRWRCYATAPMGADAGQVVRTSEGVRFQFDHFLSPIIAVEDLRDGRVRVNIESFWPEGQMSLTGPLVREGDVLRFEDEDSDRTAELRKERDGRLHLRVHQAGRTQEYALQF